MKRNSSNEKEPGKNSRLQIEFRPRSMLRIFIESFSLFLLAGLIGWITMKLTGGSF